MKPSLKSTSEADNSNCILLSFNSMWKSGIVDRSVSAFIRKRIPKSQLPDSIYCYFGSPECSVAARVRIDELRELSVGDVLKKQTQLKLSESEIFKYLGESDTVGFCEFSHHEIASSSVSLSTLRGAFKFFPPQSFLNLSIAGKDFIDENANFQLLRS